MKPHNEENPEVGGFRVRYNRTEIRDLSNENTTSCAVVKPLTLLYRFRNWLAGLLYPGRFFDKDASLEIDRLTAALEKCQEERDEF